MHNRREFLRGIASATAGIAFTGCGLVPSALAWAQNRHAITSWYGVGSGLEAFLNARGDAGLDLLKRMHEQSRLFRLVLDEVEKTLMLVDLQIARAYASLVEDEAARGAPGGGGHRRRVAPRLRLRERERAREVLARREPRHVLAPLFRKISDEQIAAFLSEDITVAQKLDRMISACLEAGGRDNITGILARI
jgi:hypothetical protein